SGPLGFSHLRTPNSASSVRRKQRTGEKRDSPPLTEVGERKGGAGGHSGGGTRHFSWRATTKETKGKGTQEQNRKDKDRPERKAKDLAARKPSAKKEKDVRGGRDAASGLPTGQRMHKPFVVT